jgi:uncharacterized protein (DUF697 family)
MSVTLESKTAEAERIVNSYVGWSAGAGLIPLPLVDLAAITAVELKMLDDLAKFYEIPFSRNAAKSIIGSLVGGTGTVLVAVPAASLLKFVPIVGAIAGMLTEPAIAAAATYALGRVFIQHFESGGTFLDFNPEDVRAHYQAEFRAKTGAAASPAAATATAAAGAKDAK